MMNTPGNAPKEQQVELAEELQMLLLQEFKKRFRSGEITSTDLATLSRLLIQNGWTLDPADLPQDLRDHITREVSFDEDIEKDSDIQVIG